MYILDYFKIMKQIKDFDVLGKRVLVRCDFNVPIDDSGTILDDFRMIKTLPTIQYLLLHDAKIILMSHLGEPGGSVVENLKLDNVKEKLEELLKLPVEKLSDCIGPEVANKVLAMENRQIILLENLRFHKEETDNDPVFAKELSELGDMYINDAFGDCHRTHASIAGIVQFLPHGAGLLLENEITNLQKILQYPKKPMVVLVGGKKVETKAAFIEKISTLADTVLVGGLIKKEILSEKIHFTYPEKIVGPKDNLDASDIGDDMIAIFREKILTAKTVVWNGPFGKFEDENFKKGTLEIAKAIVESKAFSVVGGGETIEFLRKEGMLDKFSHVSTGGGAMLEFLSGGKMPGLKALE